jgi:hypothetical protein
MDAVLAGLKGAVPINGDDRQFCLDIGLLANNPDNTLGPSDKMNEEAMSRTLTYETRHALDTEDAGEKAD